MYPHKTGKHHPTPINLYSPFPLLLLKQALERPIHKPPSNSSYASNKVLINLNSNLKPLKHNIITLHNHLTPMHTITNSGKPWNNPAWTSLTTPNNLQFLWGIPQNTLPPLHPPYYLFHLTMISQLDLKNDSLLLNLQKNLSNSPCSSSSPSTKEEIHQLTCLQVILTFWTGFYRLEMLQGPFLLVDTERENLWRPNVAETIGGSIYCTERSFHFFSLLTLMFLVLVSKTLFLGLLGIEVKF